MLAATIGTSVRPRGSCLLAGCAKAGGEEGQSATSMRARRLCHCADARAVRTPLVTNAQPLNETRTVTGAGTPGRKGNRDGGAECREMMVQLHEGRTLRRPVEFPSFATRLRVRMLPGSSCTHG